MNRTEEEAEKLICPVINRLTVAEVVFCNASACMFWEWVEESKTCKRKIEGSNWTYDFEYLSKDLWQGYCGGAR